MVQEQSLSEHDERVRKRTEIGLSPARPTAQTTFQRPPDEGESRGCLWLTVWLVGAVVLATLLLVGARLSGAPVTWSGTQSALNTWLANLTNMRDLVGDTADTRPLPAAYHLLAEDDFTQPQGLLACNQQDGQWDMVYLSDEGRYQMQIAPNRLGWSTLGAAVLRNFRLDVGLTIADLRPDGYAGIIGRYQNHANFYLFGVDGRGRYQVQLWQEGQLQTLIPWMESGNLRLAGQANVLTLEDDGTSLRLAVNEQPLFEIQSPALPVGDVGIFGAAPAQSTGEMSVDWLRLYEKSDEAITS